MVEGRDTMEEYYQLRPEVTPERLYSLCLLASRGEINGEQIRALVHPSALRVSADQINKNIGFAKKLGLIGEYEGKIKLEVPQDLVKSREKFKMFLLDKFLNDSAFSEVTRWLLQQDKTLWQDNIANTVAKIKAFERLNKEYLLAYRFWYKFFGLGLFVDNRLINNPYIFLKNFISQKGYDYGQRVLLHSFISELVGNFSVFSECVEHHSVSFSLTLGLVTLHEMGHIRLAYMPDAPHIYSLSYSIPIESHMQSGVTHFVFLGGRRI